MKTLHYEDRDWIVDQFVVNDSGRVVAREEYEEMLEFREILQSYNRAPQLKAVRGMLNAAILGGLIWGAAALLSGMI